MPAPGATTTVTALAVGLAGLGSLSLMEERAAEEARSKLQMAWVSGSDIPTQSWAAQQTITSPLQVDELELEAAVMWSAEEEEEDIRVDDGQEHDHTYSEQTNRTTEMLAFNSQQAFLCLFVLDLAIAFIGWRFARDCITKQIRRHLPHRRKRPEAEQDRPEHLIEAATLDGDVQREEVAEEQGVKQAEHDENDQQCQGSCNVDRNTGAVDALNPCDTACLCEVPFRRLTPRDSEEIAKKYVAGLIENALGYPVSVDDLLDADATSTFSFGVEDSGDGIEEALLDDLADCAPPSRTDRDCRTPRWSTEVAAATFELPEPDMAAPCPFPESDLGALKTDLHLQFAEEEEGEGGADLQAIRPEEEEAAAEQRRHSHDTGEGDAHFADQQDAAIASTDSHPPVEQKQHKDLFVPARKLFRSAARDAALLDVASPCRNRHRDVQFFATPLRQRGHPRSAAESPYAQPCAPASSPAVKIERRSPATVPRQFRTEGMRQRGA